MDIKEIKWGGYKPDNIYNEDCIEMMKSMPNESVDLIVTDPPYLMNYSSHGRKNEKHKFCRVIQNDNNESIVSNYIKECFRIMKNDTAMYMFCNSNMVDFFVENIRNAGFIIKNIIVWDKSHGTRGDLQASFSKTYEFIILANKGRRFIQGKRITDIWRIEKVSNEKLVHQNQKPVELIRRCIEYSSYPDDIVFDGFMGSGTTAVACIETGRHYLGCEIDKTYFETCLNRTNKSLKEISLSDESVQTTLFDFI